MAMKWEMLFENDPMLSTSDSAFPTLLDEDSHQQFDFVDLGDGSDANVTEGTFFADLLPPSCTSYAAFNSFNTYSEDSENFSSFVVEQREETPVEVAEVKPAAEEIQDVRTLRSPLKPKVKQEAETSAIFGNGKPKLYSVRPFKNPQRERARQNAINAKMNREKKKREAERLHADMRTLRDQNLNLRKSLRRVEARALRAEKELKAIRELLVTANVSDLLKMASDGDEIGKL